MRILEVTEASGSGTFEILRAIATGAADARHEVWVALGVRPETPADLEALFPPDVEVVGLPWASRDPRSQWRTGRALNALIRRVRPDVVHLHSSFAGLVGALSTPRGVPIIYTPHGSPTARASDSAARRLAYRLAEGLAVHRSALVGAVSQAEADLLRSRLRARRVRVVPNGIADLDPERLPAPAVRDAPRVVTVGRVTAQRLPAETASIMAGVADLAEVLWIGAAPGDEDAPVVAAGVALTGWLSREEGLLALSRASILLHWSAWDGLSLALLEAMARDVVIVASDIPANREVVGPDQVCATPGEATALVRRVLTTPALHDELLAAQRRRRGRYAQQRCVAEWLSVYAEVVAR